MQTVSPRRRPALAGLALILALGAFAPSALAAPAAVNLRIEGLRSTIYEAKVTTDGHVVRPATGTGRRCDGTNGGANPTPGPTPTSALDDGARLGGFTWDGTFFSGFDDYQVTRVASERNSSSQFWGVFVNGRATQVGGCQLIVRSGDEVLWAYDAFSKRFTLGLTGPEATHTGEPVTVKVTYTADGGPIENAIVGGQRTGRDGTAQLRFARPGIYRLKAERADSVRSRALAVCVDPPGVIACSSSDRTAPKLRVAAPRFASDGSRSRTFGLRWRGSDGAGGSGITGYRVEARPSGTKRWRPFIASTELTRAQFRGAAGKAYDFRVSAVDRAGNRNAGVTATTAVPVDDRDRKLTRFSRGWSKLKRGGAWGGRVLRSNRRGATARARLKGRRVALIGRELPRGGKLRVSVDGRKKVLNLRGKPRFRDVLWVSRRLRQGRHTLSVRVLSRAPVEIDAVAVLP